MHEGWTHTIRWTMAEFSDARTNPMDIKSMNSIHCLKQSGYILTNEREIRERVGFINATGGGIMVRTMKPRGGPSIWTHSLPWLKPRARTDFDHVSVTIENTASHTTTANSHLVVNIGWFVPQETIESELTKKTLQTSPTLPRRDGSGAWFRQATTSDSVADEE